MSSNKDNSALEPVAIIGIGCRYPNNTNNLSTFWDRVINQKDIVGEMPLNRLGDTEKLVDPNRVPGKIITNKGAFLDEIEHFDAEFFGITPREAKHLDPQQRVLLEIAYESLENAGIKHDSIRGKNMGVFIGMWSNDFERRLSNSGDVLDVYSTTGSGRYAASGRIAFNLDLRGPAITIDTACSSSLAAVHLAVQSIQSGETEMSFAGAVNIILDPIVSVSYSKSGLLSHYGRCKFGAENPKGYVRSEGAGIVLLKKLSKAIEDGDNIHAIIPGTSCNNDGQSDKFMLAPSPVTQEELIRRAHERYGISPKDVQYIEAHGTGTRVGDPAEVLSVSSALKDGRDENDFFYLGSIKSNFGHSESASGMAGLIKLILAIKNRKIPPNLHSLPANPNIPWGDYLARIPNKIEDWPRPDKTLIAGVNAFGISGTNAHVIVQEYKAAKPQVEAPKQLPKNYILPISAANEKGLVDYAKIHLQNIEKLEGKALATYIFNVAQYKGDLAYRKVISTPNKAGIIEGLNNIISSTTAENIAEEYFAGEEKPKVAFVFPGQGSQWRGMGKELYEKEVVFKETIDAFENAFSSFGDWKLKEQLFTTNDETTLNAIDIIQPALVAVEIAIAKLWQSWGIQPDAVIGHSMGEVGSAYISGSITINEAAAIICSRSKLMKSTSGKGAMGYVALTSDEMKERLKGIDNINIAVQNSPKSVVISGDTSTLESLLEKWDAEGIFCRKIKVDVASHSPQMDVVKEELRSNVQNINPSASKIPFWSSVQSNEVAGEALKADYWVSNLRQPVQFAETIQNMVKENFTVFIEMSPHPVLTQAIAENIEHLNASAIAFGSIEREKPELQQIGLNIGKAYCNGVTPNWPSIYGGTYPRIELPNYPWQKEHFWPDESMRDAGNQTIEKRNGKWAHPLLARKVDLKDKDGVVVWETLINKVQFGYLKDHKVHDAVVFPAAGYMEATIAAIQEEFGAGDHTIENFVIKEAISIPEKGNVTLQVILNHTIGNSYQVTLRSKISNQDVWNDNASCNILVNYKRDLSNISNIQGEKITQEEHYQFTNDMSLPYGDMFQTVQQIEHQDKKWSAHIRVHEKIFTETKSYLLHPTLLDGCLQVALNISRNKSVGSTYVPVQIDEFYIADSIEGVDNCTVIIEELDAGIEWINCNMVIVHDGKTIARMNGLKMKKLEASSVTNTTIDNLLYEINWQSITLENKADESPYNIVVSSNSQLLQTIADKTISIKEDSWLKTLVNLKDSTNQSVNIIFDATGNYGQSTEAFYEVQEKVIMPFVELIQALLSAEWAPKVFAITNGVDAYKNNTINTALATIWGMGRVILNEHPEFKFTRIDLSANASTIEVDTLQQIITSESNENEFLVRNNEAFVARLDNTFTQSDETSVKLAPSNGAAYKAIVDEPGILDNIKLKQCFRAEPKAHEVEIEVKAIGINFMNLMSALGIYPGKENGFGTLGIECAGIITKVGKNVTHLSVGDAVLGMAYHTMSTHVIADASLMRKKPSNFTFEEAATIPVVFLTSYYAMVYLGRLKKGEKVLIHSATGGVGLSAIQIAQAIGAEIYATAGTEEKRALLQSMGVKHVYNSRDLEFAEAIKKDTNGEGIDMVLNSLTGEAMLRSLNLLKSFGRFLEIGKKDVYENSEIGLSVFNKAISYSMIDLEKMLFETPAVLGDMLEEVLKDFENNTYKPLTNKVFGISKVKEAFDFMSKAKHIGKIVISFENENPEIEVLENPKTQFDSKATYLLTGGYGGLGITFTKWMVKNGAQNLILVGRSGPKPFAQEIIDELTGKGVNIKVAKADVSSKADLANIIQQIPTHQPLKGIMHLAGILDDAAISNLTYEQYKRVLQPKINGAISLHELSQSLNLDFFVLFSSSSILFGSPGQSAYVAANTYLDQLAAQRRAAGLQALSINWGTVSEVGLAAGFANRADRLAEEGVLTLSPDECIKIYERIANAEHSSVGAFRFDLAKWQNAYLSAAKNPFFEHLRDEETTSEDEAADSFIETLVALNDADLMKDNVEAKLKELVSAVVKKAADKINIKTPFKSLGIDSLMSIQLKNRLEATFEIPISVTSFWTYSNIRDYTKFLMDELPLGDISTQTKEKVEEKTIVVEEEKEIEELSVDDIADEDISDLLAAELGDL